MAAPAPAIAFSRLPAGLGVERPQPRMLPTGVEDLPGIPQSRVTEIVGAACSGKTSLLYRILAAASQSGHFTAIVDATDAFDPVSAYAAGVCLESLLWVRCGGDVEHAVRAADLLMHAGGFGVVALDLSEAPARQLSRIPLSWWHRARLASENSTSALVVLSGEPVAKACAAAVYATGRPHAQFTGRAPFRLLSQVNYTIHARKPVHTMSAAALDCLAADVPAHHS